MTLIVNINTKRTDLPSSALKPIGEELEKLARNFQNGSVSPNSSVPAIDLNFSGQEASNIAVIAGSMSISRVTNPGSGSWQHEETLFGSTPSDLLAKNINVKFVFEGPDEMILVVRDADALDFGLHTGLVADNSGTISPDIEQKPPMKEASYIENVPEVRDFILKLLEDASSSIAASATRDTVISGIVDFFDDNFPVLDSTSAKSVFYRQLGAYSVRQCS